MAYEVSYVGDNSKRRAINDLCRYIGLGPSKVVCREARRIAAIENEEQRNKAYNGLSFQISMFLGVSGEPVRRLFAHYGGEAQLESWLKSPD